MSSINNLKGTIVKDGKVVHSEKIDEGLYFNVIVKYLPFYDGKNTTYHQASSSLEIQALISDGSIHEWGNGVRSLNEADKLEYADKDGVFPKIKEPLITKDGFKVWKKDYNYGEGYLKDSKGVVDYEKPRKTRQLIWLVEVPKLELIKYCK